MATNKVIKVADWIWRMVRYNLKIIFANKFIWFLLAALGFFIMVTLITLFSGNMITTGTVYNLLLYPGLLLIFYPTVFGIQNDEDSRMLEILFGIPDYRYKVWLVRLVMILLLVFTVLLLLAWFCSWTLVSFTPLYMTFHLIFPVFLMGSLAFLLSTVVRNGIGTAVIMVIIGIVFSTLSEALDRSKWNVFLNPFKMPDQLSETVWLNTVHDNRIIILVAIILFILGGLLSMQRREKFM
ncbi:MAG: hypothetical protein J7L96_10645 [Bacteroidales bacterium]|nr:hypothetical protein [Bacteroidales bacterium]